MKRILSIPILLSVVIVAIAMLAGAPFASDPGVLGTVGLLAFGGLIAPNSADTDVAKAVMPYRRVRKDLPSFENVVATGKATCVIPRKALTLLGATLKLGGTTFNESHITEVRIRLGSKTLWGPISGADLRKLNLYKGYYDGNRQFLHIDFSQSKCKMIGGEMVGGIDMTKLPTGKFVIEVTTSGATAPTLAAKGHWGPPQANGVIQRLIQFASWSSSSGGRKTLGLDLLGLKVRRVYAIFGGTDWAASAAPSAAGWATNTGGVGTVGTITPSAGVQVGVHKIVIVEPAANAGTFVHYTPDGKMVSVKGTVASAYSGGGLAFTVADATDFASGDGFDITVSENLQGNVTRLEVIKNGESVWDFYDDEARQLQKQKGFVPVANMAVIDFEVDNWPDGVLPTGTDTTKELEWAATLTATDTITFYAEVLDTPTDSPS